MEDNRLLDQTLQSILDSHCTPERIEEYEGRLDEKLWDTLVDAGLTLVGIPEEAGGSGGDLGTAARIVQTAASFAAQIPIADTLLLAAWARWKTGMPVPTHPETVVVLEDPTIDNDRLSGESLRVPWVAGRPALLIVAVGRGGDAVVQQADPSQITIEPNPNVAGEPHGDVKIASFHLVDAHRLSKEDVQDLFRRQALSRSLMIAGALRTTLSLTTSYSTERRQFDRPISSFQAIRQQIAILAGEAAAASVAADAATTAMDSGGGDIEAFSARLRCAQAATIGTRIAHQVHGAIGFTREHRLHHFTRRLWAWRDDLGTERSYKRALGKVLMTHNSQELWGALVR